MNLAVKCGLDLFLGTQWKYTKDPCCIAACLFIFCLGTRRRKRVVLKSPKTLARTGDLF